MRIALPSSIFSCVSVLSLFLAGCGPEFDPPSELHSLRVLGVQKDHPYAQPGSDVNMQMLWQDASPLAGEDRPIQIAWSPGCYDPPGDLYYACFADQSLFGDMTLKAPPPSTERATVHIPDDIISRRGRFSGWLQGFERQPARPGRLRCRLHFDLFVPGHFQQQSEDIRLRVSR